MRGKLVEIDGRQYDEYEIKTKKQTVIIKEYMPTAEELKQQEYDTTRNQLLEDIKVIDEDILILDATQADRDARLALWTQWKIDNGYA